MQLNQSLLNERILRVRYEDLVLHPEPTLRGICAFIDARFEAQMLRWHAKVDNAVPLREKRFHSSLGRDMDPSDVSRWKREMTSREIFVAEALIGTQLSHFGYERRFQSAGWTPLLALARIYCRQVLPFLGRVMREFKRRSAGLRACP
jgi:hypothetical protein